MKKILLGFLALSLCAVSLTAQDDVASPSDNVPPKKEALSAKIKRYESAGYKIAVVFSSPDLYVTTPNPSLMMGEPGVEKAVPVLIAGTEPLCECFEDKTDELIGRLNTQYGTTIFEDVDPEGLPKRTALGISTEDWWNTKYKPNSGSTFPGTALVGRIMNLESIWNNPAF